MQLVARVPRTTASQVAAKRICVPSVRQVIARRVCASSSLAQQRCEPCESAKESLDQMGLSMIMDRDTAQKYLSQVNPGWRIVEDDQQRLRIRRSMRTKNFKKALELFGRIGDVAEAEGHHPDLHLVGWNNVEVEVWTHARSGLSENDFILAAKIDELDISDLLSKKQPQQASSH